MSHFQFDCIINGCSVSSFGSQLRVNQSLANFPSDITDIVVSSDKVFALYTKNGCSFDELPRNNIVAYDFSGQYLYAIGDIIQEDWPFSKIEIHSAATINQVPETHMLTAVANHEYLVCYTYGALRFILDVTNDTLFQKASGRFQ